LRKLLIEEIFGCRVAEVIEPKDFFGCGGLI
jgi:hypothetical protein